MDTVVEFKTLAQDTAGTVVLRQFFPAALGQTTFVARASNDLLHFSNFVSTNASDFAMVLIEQANGRFAISIGGGWIGYDGTVDQLRVVVSNADPMFVTWDVVRTNNDVPTVVGLSFRPYNGYFGGNVSFFQDAVALQPLKVTTNTTTLSAATNNVLA